MMLIVCVAVCSVPPRLRQELLDVSRLHVHLVGVSVLRVVHPDHERTAAGFNSAASTQRTQEVLKAREAFLTNIAPQGEWGRKRW